MSRETPPSRPTANPLETYGPLKSRVEKSISGHSRDGVIQNLERVATRAKIDESRYCIPYTVKLTEMINNFSVMKITQLVTNATDVD